MYTLGSLFTGIGGIDLAFQWAGFEIAWQVEIDDYCNRVLDRHWPAVARHRDVREVRGCDVCPVDVLAGGFPCQPFSAAGLQRGADDPRNMWPEFRRLIGELRPRVVLLENVPAITPLYGTVVIGDLAALGYVASWGVISAADAGAPHLRERWWCVAMADTPESGLPERGYAGQPACAEETGARLEFQPERRGELAHASSTGLAQWQGQPGDDGQEQPPAERSNRNGNEVMGNAEFSGLGGQSRGRPGSEPANGHSADSGRIESGLGRELDGLPARLDGPGWWRGWPAGLGQEQHEWEPPRTVPAGSVKHRAARLKALGNAVVPQVVYPIAVEIRRALELMDA